MSVHKPKAPALTVVGAGLVALGVGGRFYRYGPGVAERPAWAALLLWGTLAVALFAAAVVTVRWASPVAPFVATVAGGVALLSVYVPCDWLVPFGPVAVGGVAMAGAGLAHVDLRTLVRTERRALAGALAAALVAELAFGAVSTAVYVLPYVWAMGALGIWLIPLAVVAGVRVARSGDGWWRRAGAVAGTAGALLVLVGPLVAGTVRCIYPATGGIGPCWEPLRYAADYGALAFESAGGGCRADLSWWPVAAGGALLAAGTAVAVDAGPESATEDDPHANT